jgi:hypothetical protein
MTKCPYSIEVNKRLIILDISGYLGIGGIQAIREEIEAILAEGKGPRDLLAKVDSNGSRDDEARREAAKLLREVSLRRIAVVGVKPHLIRAANAVLRLAGNGGRLKLFRSEEDARAWLSKRR